MAFNSSSFSISVQDAEPIYSILCGFLEYFCCSYVFQETNSLRRTMHSGVQFITLVGPRQSLLLAKDPDQFL